MSTLILKSINQAIDKIEFENESFSNLAKQLCHQVFGLYIIQDGNFDNYQSLSRPYFRSIIGGVRYLSPILNELKRHNILLCDEKYNKKLGIAKGYKFNKELIYGNSKIEFSSFNSIKESRDPETNMKKYMKQVTFDHNIDVLIKNTITLMISRIITNDLITDSSFELKMPNAKIHNTSKTYVTLSFAKQMAAERNLDLIKFNKKIYLDDLTSFIERKQIELEIIYTKKVTDIIIGKHYASRNTTNNRLDSNITNLKKELFCSLLFDDEKTIEIDIANAQFAILSYIATKELDSNFNILAQNGILYSYVEEKLQLEPGKGKMLMFRIAFDKSKKDHDQIRNIFPKTMTFIDNYKKENGYKLFSNLLQKAESELMIDGIFKMLNEKGIESLPIHDAIRVKKSDSEIVENFIKEYFVSKDFKCKLNIDKE